MVGDGLDVVGNGWDVMVKGLVLLGGVFFIFFLGFAIDRSKNYIKTCLLYTSDAADE